MKGSDCGGENGDGNIEKGKKRRRLTFRWTEMQVQEDRRRVAETGDRI